MALRTLLVLSIGLAAWSGRVSAGELVDLFMKVPAPPDNGSDASSWMRNGHVVAPQYVEVYHLLDQQRTPSAPSTPSMGTDTPGVLAAVQGYTRYKSNNSGDKDPAQVLAKRSAWITKRFDNVRQRSGNYSVADHNAVDDELRAWGALFRDWQNTRRALVEQGERDLVAAGAAADIRDGANVTAVTAYRAAMLHEIETSLSISRKAVERVAGE